MKIKLKKDILGYEANAIVEFKNVEDSILMWVPDYASGKRVNHIVINYPIEYLLKNGWAEEVTDEIDMEEVRDKFGLTWETNGVGPMLPVLHKVNETEAKFFTAYRIVKHVIDTLNGDSKFEDGFELFRNSLGEFDKTPNHKLKFTFLPSLKDKVTAEKIIEFCKPELEILFGFSQLSNK